MTNKIKVRDTQENKRKATMGYKFPPPSTFLREDFCGIVRKSWKLHIIHRVLIHNTSSLSLHSGLWFLKCFLLGEKAACMTRTKSKKETLHRYPVPSVSPVHRSTCSFIHTVRPCSVVPTTWRSRFGIWTPSRSTSRSRLTTTQSAPCQPAIPTFSVAPSRASRFTTRTFYVSHAPFAYFSVEVKSWQKSVISS